MPPRGNAFSLHREPRARPVLRQDHIWQCSAREQYVQNLYLPNNSIDCHEWGTKSTLTEWSKLWKRVRSVRLIRVVGIVAFGFHTESFNSFMGLKSKIHALKKLVFGYLFEFRVRRPARAAVSPVAPQPISASRLRAHRGLATSHSAQPIRNYLMAEDGPYECWLHLNGFTRFPRWLPKNYTLTYQGFVLTLLSEWRVKKAPVCTYYG